MTKIKIKFSQQRFRALAKQHHNLIDCWESVGEHDKLLYEHLVEISSMIDRRLALDQNNYTLSLTSAQGLAFFQIWNSTGLDHDPYSRVIITTAIAAIDKASKAPKPYIP